RMRAQAYPGEDPMDLPEPSALGPLFVSLAGQPDLPAQPQTLVFKAD
ncbi:MAG: oxidoreductase, partial [Caulobacteraceae bacterium]|nr:oxidoreductase [Caulobacteraceae bacterium]